MTQLDITDIIASNITPTTDQENIWDSKPDPGKAFLYSFTNIQI
jgi:hypothetical protein